MLEVRNNNWTQESIENYKKFLKHIFEDRLNDCNNDINTIHNYSGFVSTIVWNNHLNYLNNNIIYQRVNTILKKN